MIQNQKMIIKRWNWEIHPSSHFLCLSCLFCACSSTLGSQGRGKHRWENTKERCSGTVKTNNTNQRLNCCSAPQLLRPKQVWVCVLWARPSKSKQILKVNVTVHSKTNVGKTRRILQDQKVRWLIVIQSFWCSDSGVSKCNHPDHCGRSILRLEESMSASGMDSISTLQPDQDVVIVCRKLAVHFSSCM